MNKNFFLSLIFGIGFVTNSDAQIKIDNSGRIGLRVLSQLTTDIQTNGVIKFGTANGDLWLDNTGTLNVAVLRPGIDWLGHLGTPTHRFGDIFAHHVIALQYTPSDKNLKQNINLLKFSFNDFEKLQPVSFYYNDEVTSMRQTGDGLAAAPLHFGFLAQDVQNIYPNLVKRIDENTLAINYTEMIPLLVIALQNQQREIELLNEALLAQEAKASSIDKNLVINSYTISINEGIISLKYDLNLKNIDNHKGIAVVTDLTGKMIVSRDLSNSNGELDLTNEKLISGIYITSVR